MPTTFVVSDTHFGHSNIIKYCGRPFKNVDEMNQTMVTNWNAVVTQRDTVIHVGDLGWHGVHYWAKQLNGRKVLVLGNHDGKLSAETKKLFAHVTPMLEAKIEGQTVVFCHYPMMAWSKSHHGSLHLHGHSHGGGEELMSYLRWDVSVDVWNFTPVPWDIIMDKYNYKKPIWAKAIREMPVGIDITNRQNIITFNEQFLKRGEDHDRQNQGVVGGTGLQH